MSLEILQSQITEIVDGVDGIMGVAVQNVETGEEIGIRADEFFPMASVYKTPILVHTYRQQDAGQISLDTRIELTRETRTPGSGLLNFFDAGLQPTLRDLLLMMIVVSDNAATDLVLGQVGGPEAVTATMQELGRPDIRLNRTVRQLLDDVLGATDSRVTGLGYYEMEALFAENEEVKAVFQDWPRVREGIRVATEGRDCATPRAIARLYAQIARKECASQDSGEAILKTLERQQLRGRLPRELPPGTWRFCHKTGTLGPGTVTNDSGLLIMGEKSVAVAVLSREVAQEPAITNTAIAHIGRAVYDHFASQR